MTIIPAIDLLDGQVVRLTKGDYNQKKSYGHQPIDQARLFKEAGFKHIHVVDLNGAKSGKFENLPHIRRIINEVGLSVQSGGGIRSFDDVETLLDAGISRVICSSMAVKAPDQWSRALDAYADRCILGLDLRDGKMAYGGWLETTDEDLSTFLNPMIGAGLRTVLSTDIARDGTLEGPNTDMYRELKQEFPDLGWIASGGVSTIKDCHDLVPTGVEAVVVGKAYYEGRVSLNDLKQFNLSQQRTN